MKQRLSALLTTVIIIIASSITPMLCNANGPSASIRATATVTMPLGITEFVDQPDSNTVGNYISGSYIVAPAYSNAFVTYSLQTSDPVDNLGELSTSVQANSDGLVSLEFFEKQIANSAEESSLLTIILTEN